jgi:Uma2 family endonuclease
VATATLRLGPADHGRPLTLDEFETGDYEPGYKYELIDGRLEVSPTANPPENRLERWLDGALTAYAALHPEVINFVTSKARVFIPGRHAVTCPEPDLLAYRDFPLEASLRRGYRWNAVHPILVAEVLVEGEPEKDLVRNVELYLQAPSIKEYLVLDGRADPANPTLFVHRRRGARWQRAIEVRPGETYTTRLLPGFSLPIDPLR